jgi:hypothetical protein
VSSARVEERDGKMIPACCGVARFPRGVGVDRLWGGLIHDLPKYDIYPQVEFGPGEYVDPRATRIGAGYLPCQTKPNERTYWKVTAVCYL